jgi:Holliday junction DNA helicase RuvA
MIAHLRGTLLEKHPNQAIVEAGGVGYDVTIPVGTFTALGEPGSVVSLRIHTHVREDAIQLFGFESATEKALFERLIGVSGIGPKLAITALSGLAAAELARVIRARDIASLTRVPGIGKKTAERIVLELRDKMEGLGAPAGAVKGPAEPVLSPDEQDVVSALANLGCQRAQAETAARKAVSELGAAGFEALFRRALEILR